MRVEDYHANWGMREGAFKNAIAGSYTYENLLFLVILVSYMMVSSTTLFVTS
jgi:hypothetical protein